MTNLLYLKGIQQFVKKIDSDTNKIKSESATRATSSWYMREVK